MTIDNIKKYLSKDKNQEFTKIIKKIYEMTAHLNKIYPDYHICFFDKQVKERSTPKRNIFFVMNEEGKIITASCLKKTKKEKKYAHYSLLIVIEDKKLALYF